jgi:hypothetical protein
MDLKLFTRRQPTYRIRSRRSDVIYAGVCRLSLEQFNYPPAIGLVLVPLATGKYITAGAHETPAEFVHGILVDFKPRPSATFCLTSHDALPPIINNSRGDAALSILWLR